MTPAMVGLVLVCASCAGGCGASARPGAADSPGAPVAGQAARPDHSSARSILAQPAPIPIESMRGPYARLDELCAAMGESYESCEVWQNVDKNLDGSGAPLPLETPVLDVAVLEARHKEGYSGDCGLVIRTAEGWYLHESVVELCKDERRGIEHAAYWQKDVNGDGRSEIGFDVEVYWTRDEALSSWRWMAICGVGKDPPSCTPHLLMMCTPESLSDCPDAVGYALDWSIEEGQLVITSYDDEPLPKGARALTGRYTLTF